MKLVVGLGNPGGEYRKTRHNAGFIFLNSFLSKEGISLDKKKFKGEYIDYVSSKGNKAIFLEPQTYMNLSGDSIVDFVRYYKIDLKDILVIYDDLDLDVGKIRIRANGSSAGQKGMQNIINLLASQEVKIVRIGISKGRETISHVLGAFSEDEKASINISLDKANDMFHEFVTNSFDKFMNRFN